MMTPAYDHFVSAGKWRLVLLALALTALGGAALAFALLLGAADPPHAATLVYNARHADDFIHAWDYSGGQVFALPNMTLSLPLTVEIEARNAGPPSSAWGLAVASEGGQDSVPPIMIDNFGYAITRVGGHDYAHLQFPHIQFGANRISVHIGADGLSSVRINDELLRQQSFSPDSRFSVFLYHFGAPVIAWEAIKIYTG